MLSKLEKINLEELRKVQFKKLNLTLRQARKSYLYSKIIKVPTRISSFDDFINLPFTTKEHLKTHGSQCALAIPMDRVAEVHTSSGTTLEPITSYFSFRDLELTKHYLSRAWAAFGVRRGDIVQIAFSYGLFSGAMLNQYAIHALGATVIPIGAGNTLRQIQFLADLKCTMLVTTPSFYFYLYSYMKTNGLKPKNLFLNKGVGAGEPYTNQTRKKIEKLFNITLFDHYGLAELNTGIAYECEYKDGLHIIGDYVYPEIIDPTTGKILPEGAIGELVLTTLEKEAAPLIRYRIGDLTSITYKECKCERTHPRINKIIGRTDDIVFYKGNKIIPSELAEFIFSSKPTPSDFSLLLSKYGNAFKPVLRIESVEIPPQTQQLFFEENLYNVLNFSVKVEYVNFGTLRKENKNKTKHVEFIEEKRLRTDRSCYGNEHYL